MRGEWLILGLVLVLVAGCASLRPLWVAAPERHGLTCLSGGLCLDDLSREGAARGLMTEALTFVEGRLGPMQARPRFLFCSTEACFERFGDTRVSALYVSGLGAVVVNAKGWVSHILRHEVIHHWQAEQFGPWAVARGMPRWYIEGMAYHLSEDPRRPIPHGEAEAARARFAAWVSAGNDWRVPPG